MKYIDKVYHFGVCFVAALWSWQFALGLAIGKEYGNKWCWLDMAANIAGVICGHTVKILLGLWG